MTLRAVNAPIPQILAEWARVGGATIMNGKDVFGPLLTLELTSVPEQEALDIVLRGVAGYVLGSRTVTPKAASIYDRILVLPNSHAPADTPRTDAVTGQRPRGIPPPAGAARLKELGAEGRPPRAAD